jgi:DNA-directed RNA polymerase
VMKYIYGSNINTITRELSKLSKAEQWKDKFDQTIDIVKHILTTFECEYKHLIDIFKNIRKSVSTEVFNSGYIHINTDICKSDLIYNKYLKCPVTLEWFDDNNNIQTCNIKHYVALNTPSRTKARNACVANLIHSLDAQIMANVMMEFNNRGLYIDSIHDCFLISIKNHDLLLELYHKELYKIYINRINILNNFKYLNIEFLNNLPKDDYSASILNSRSGLKC